MTVREASASEDRAEPGSGFDVHLTRFQTWAWLSASGLLGVFLAVPLRKHFIDDEKLVFEIARGVINGPNFHCIMGNPRPAGTRLEDYDSKCTLGDQVRVGTLSLDLSDKADHVRVKLPEKTDWLTIYPCK